MKLNDRGFKLMLVIIFVGFLVYAPVLGNGFVWDDEEQILANSAIRRLSNLPALFSGSTFNAGGSTSLGGAYYKPLMMVYFMFIYNFLGSSAVWFHLVQLCLHLVNGLLVFLILSALFTREKATKQFASTIAFLSAFFFTIHPGISETVVYISAAQDVLFTLFGLLAFYWVIVSLDNRSPWHFWLGPVFLLLSLLSKEAGFMFMPLILLYLYVYNPSKISAWIGGCLNVTAIYLLLRLGIAKIPFSSPMIVPIARASLSVRLLTLPFELYSYLRLSIFPYWLSVSQHRIINGISDPAFYLPLVVILCFLSAVIYLSLKIKSKLFIFFAFWFILALAPTLNIIPTDMTVAERWLYVPVIGLLAMIIIIFYRLPGAILYGIGTYACIATALIFSIRTVWRITLWRDGLTLYTHDIKINPDAFDLNNNYGVELFRADKANESLKYFDRSITLAPGWWTSFNNAGAVWENKGDFTKAAEYYQKSINNGSYYLAWENLANLELNQKKYDNAMVIAKKGLAKLPFNARLNRIAALSAINSGDKMTALYYAKRAYALDSSPEQANLLQSLLNNVN